MTPYYQDEWATIYHGDGRLIAPTLAERVDLLVTDPPYGVNLNTKFRTAKRSRLAEANDYPPVYDDDKPFDPSPWLGYPGVILWGANYYADRLPPRGSWLVWDKRDGVCQNDQADAELAWVSGVTGTVPRLFRHVWMGMVKASERNGRRLHPTQKPVELMQWCLSFFPDAQTVLDPYMGSGTTLVAAKNLQRRAIGIEMEERYCEAAATRLSQEVLNLGATA